MDPAMLIDGRLVSGSASFPVVDPATEAVAGHAPECTPEQLDEAMGAARRSQPAWAADDPARVDALLAAADRLGGACDELAELVTTEQGKPIADARQEVNGTAAKLRYFAQLALEPDVLVDDDGVRVELWRRPLGVVAAITPWNYPLQLAAWKLAPALRAGNTVVLKPSPDTPLATLRLGELLRDAFPPGVLNIVSGGDELGAAMTRHEEPDKVSFTGSVAAGRHVAAAAGAGFKRVTLELGGNDPAIVLAGADPDDIAERLFWAAFKNSGQACAAVKRVYAHESVHDALVAALAERATATRVGPGAVEGTLLGPLTNRAQRDRVAELVGDALDAGACAVTGGRRPEGPGWFYPPTVLSGARDGMRIVDEEQFGPALPVVRVTSSEEAVAAANATRFGLGASVWGGGPEEAAAIAARLEAGTVWIDAHLVLPPVQPFGGAKASGMGVENGPLGLLEYTQLQVRHRRK